MSTNINDTSRTNESRPEPEGPGAGHMHPGWIVAVAIYLVLVSALVLYGLIKLWPYPTPSGERPTDQAANAHPPGDQPNTSGNSQTQGGNAGGSTNTGGATNPPASGGNPQTPPANTSGGSTTPPSGTGGSQTPPNNSGGAANNQPGQTQQQNTNAGGGAGNNEKPKKELPDPEYIKFFWGRFEPAIYLETRLLLLVMLAGALGSVMHSLRSLYWYTGNRKMIWSWVAFYVLLPITGALLSTIFYFVVRGGFFSSQASFDTTSPFGFAALSALVGLFSPQATLKLKEVAETIFSKPTPGADSKPQESTTPGSSTKPAPTITSVTPNSGSATTSVVIAGTNFAAGAVVNFGDVAGTVSSVTDTSITVVVPANASATGPVDVQVTNADGKTVRLPQAFTYVAGNAVDAAAVDELDGHEEIKSNTTDEELPITEGGVE